MLHIEAVLMHIGQFVKDNSLHFSRPSQLQAWQSLLQSKLCGLVPKSQIHLLENTPSSTRLKEGIAMASEPSNNLLLVYYAGCVVLRKDRLYLATTESTAALAHVNAVPVEQVLDILQESNAKHIVWLVDATYRQERSEQSAFAVWKETLHRYPELRDRLSCGLALQPVEERQHTSPMDDLLAQISQGLADLQQEQLSLHDFWQHSLAQAPGTLWVSEVEQPLQWIANAHLLRRQQAENWIVEADHYFEVDKFERALALYRQAAEVLPSEELSEAIARCERWIRKEQAIKGRIEVQLWNHLCEWDAPQGYAFYLNAFPEGKYREQAQARIQPSQPEQPVEPQSEQYSTVDEMIDHLADAPTLEPLLFQINDQLAKGWQLEETPEVPSASQEIEMEVAALQPEEVAEVLPELVAQTPQEDVVEDFVENVVEDVVENAVEAVAEAAPDAVVESPEQPEEQVGQPTLLEMSTAPEHALAQNPGAEVVAQLELLPESELKGMSESQLWDYVRQVNTVASYRTYLSLSKENTYMKDAYYAIHQLGREDLPDPEPLEVMPAEEPQASQPQEVQLDEEALWAQAQAEDTIEAYMQYLGSSVENRYIPNAYARISTLKLAASRKPVQQQRPVEEVPQQQEEASEVVAEEAPEVVAEETPEVVAEEQTPVQEEILIQTVALEETPVQPMASRTLLAQEPAEIALLQQEQEQLDIIDRTAGPEEEQLWQKALADNTLSAYFSYLNRTTEKIYWAEAKQRIAQLKADSQAKEEQEWEKTCQEDTMEAYKQYIKRYPLGNYYAQATIKLNAFHADLQ